MCFLPCRWHFYLQELSGGHWISVSRGPPEDIVDAWGDFTDSLNMLKIPDKQMQVSSVCSCLLLMKTTFSLARH